MQTIANSTPIDLVRFVQLDCARPVLLYMFTRHNNMDQSPMNVDIGTRDVTDCVSSLWRHKLIVSQRVASQWPRTRSGCSAFISIYSDCHVASHGIERISSGSIGTHKRHYHHSHPSTHAWVNYEKKSREIKDLHTHKSPIYHFGLTLTLTIALTHQ